MAQLPHSPYNPFLSRAEVAPTPTGASYQPPPGPPPPGGSQVHTAAPSSSGPVHAESTPASSNSDASLELLSEDMPPAYTLGPDIYQGERSLEYGPARPFQPPPPQPQLTAGMYSHPPGQQHQQYHPPPPHGWSGPALQYPPPPMHPSQAPPGPISDFARDFYASGAGPSTSGNQQQHAPPPGPPSLQQQYAPPPGPPPVEQKVPSAPDDQRPTTMPTPGHPLLRNGKTLVYPRGYQCHKCSNSGYKNFDPTRPCSKCWDHYARPYAGALVYAPDASSGSSQSTNLQRPLPVRITNSLPPAIRPQGSYPVQTMYSSMPTMMYPTGPPPGAVVYSPGDTRLGGQRCFRCDGRGVNTILLVDVPCNQCHGVGRVYS
ncbi:unnamed protein product [Mycena citricolor]|uniref:Uncharacterized protein n=1 Tax=Mycena citricolor TaxID=2018698 RepID=A0AAD2HZB7_9AGAR|nr:unnamed protein product [Mycena citricolor]